jgi:hydroxypyruvate isomerase
MPRLAANLTFLFNELPFAERFRAAADAGFGGVEYLFPYEHPAPQLREWLDAAGLQQVLLNMPAGDWANGERGLACLPGREAEFRDGVGRAIDYARALDCPRVHVVAGLAPDAGPERRPYEDAYRANLAYAADRFAEAGLAALVEPINVKRDVPGFFMRSTGQARAVMRELARPNIRLQFDAYHVQVSEGDLVHTFRDCLADIGHIQIANPPDRHEPDCGEIDYAYFLGVVDESGYDGWVAGEYKPRGRTVDGLAWGRRWGLRA